VVVAGKLGFDITAESDLAQHAAVDRLEAGGIDVEPVEVSVEHQQGRVRLTRGESGDLIERRQIAVKPADDINCFGNQLRRARKIRRRIAV
jgi:hypothetical protein